MPKNYFKITSKVQWDSETYQQKTTLSPSKIAWITLHIEE
jgi:hypothetical protein